MICQLLSSGIYNVEMGYPWNLLFGHVVPAIFQKCYCVHVIECVRCCYACTFRLFVPVIWSIKLLAFMCALQQTTHPYGLGSHHKIQWLSTATPLGPFLLVPNQTPSAQHSISFVIQTWLHLYPLLFLSSSLTLSQHASGWKTVSRDLLLSSIHSCFPTPPSLSFLSHPTHYRQTDRHVLLPVPHRSDGWQQ